MIGSMRPSRSWKKPCSASIYINKIATLIPLRKKQEQTYKKLEIELQEIGRNHTSTSSIFRRTQKKKKKLRDESKEKTKLEEKKNHKERSEKLQIWHPHLNEMQITRRGSLPLRKNSRRFHTASSKGVWII